MLHSVVCLISALSFVSSTCPFAGTTSFAAVDSSVSFRDWSCSLEVTQAKCTDFDKKYRRQDGTCNNLESPLSGAAFRPFSRLLPAEYDDGIGAPRAHGLPPVRHVSHRVLHAHPELTAPYNLLLMQFGQFIAHDISKSLDYNPHFGDQACACSTKATDSNEPDLCLPIPIDKKDPAFGKFECLPNGRSLPACGTGRNGSVREQFNLGTPYLDVGILYGHKKNVFDEMRDGAFLKNHTVRGREFPRLDHFNMVQVGDPRANLFIGLTAIHILFLREHNRIAHALQSINVHWDGDRVFHESRLILGAMYQRIVFYDYLPRIFGSRFSKYFPPYNGYKPEIDVSTRNEFQTAAFRFGHGQIRDWFPFFDEDGSYPPDKIEGIWLPEGAFRPTILAQQGIDRMIRGMVATPIKTSQNLASSVTEQWIGTTDLGAIDVNRGRDHGIPGYTKFRRLCKLRPIESWDQVEKMTGSRVMRQRLQKVYEHIDDIDAYAGMLLEKPIGDSLIGPTAACLISEQLLMLRDGDRFYYENAEIFSGRQTAELSKATLGRVLCDSGDDIHRVPQNAFDLPHMTDILPCDSVPTVDLNAWKDDEP